MQEAELGSEQQSRDWGCLGTKSSPSSSPPRRALGACHPPLRSPACLRALGKADLILPRARWVSLGHQHGSPSPNIHLLPLSLPIFLTTASHAHKTSEVCCASQVKLPLEGEKSTSRENAPGVQGVRSSARCPEVGHSSLCLAVCVSLLIFSTVIFVSNFTHRLS